MGFIGSNLVPHLLNNGHKVVGFDNLVNPSVNPTGRMKSASGQHWDKFKFYNCDIRDLNNMYSICANENPDVIVHLAALGSVPRSFDNPSEVIEVNEKGFSNILLLASGIKCKRVIFASSSSVYGNNFESVKKEGREGSLLSPYALTKSSNEHLARLMCKGLGIKYVGLRFFNVYGPGQRPDSAYSAVIPKFINDHEIVINGDGSTVRDFTFVDDVCEAIKVSITTPYSNFVCNIGTGRGTDLSMLARLISNSKKEIKYSEPRPGDVKSSIADTKKAQEYLSWSAKVSIDDGIPRTIASYEGQ